MPKYRGPSGGAVFRSLCTYLNHQTFRVVNLDTIAVTTKTSIQEQRPVFVSGACARAKATNQGHYFFGEDKDVETMAAVLAVSIAAQAEGETNEEGLRIATKIVRLTMALPRILHIDDHGLNQCPWRQNSPTNDQQRS